MREPGSEALPLLFVRLAMGLKDVARTGWLDRGVNLLDIEPVADHSWAARLLVTEDPSVR